MISSCSGVNRANWMHRLASGGRISSKGTLPRENHCYRKAGRTGHPRNDGGVAATPKAAGRVTEWRAARAAGTHRLVKNAMCAKSATCGTETIDAARDRALRVLDSAFASCFAER